MDKKETQSDIFSFAELENNLKDPAYAVDYLIAMADFGSEHLLAAARMIVRANGGTVNP